MPAGRPSKYDPSMCEDVVALMSEGATKTQVACALGISKETLHQWINPDSDYFISEFSDSIKRGHVKAQAWWEAELQKAASGKNKDANATLMIFAMKNMFRDDWSDMQTVENTHRYVVSDTPTESEQEWLDKQPK
jgi:hypothetical protein